MDYDICSALVVLCLSCGSKAVCPIDKKASEAKDPHYSDGNHNEDSIILWKDFKRIMGLYHLSEEV